MKISKILLIFPILGITASLHSAIVYTGGMYSKSNTIGMSDLTNLNYTTDFRSKGGRFYIHELAWAHSSSAVKAALPGIFPAAPIWESSMPAYHALGQLTNQCKPNWDMGAWCLTVNYAVDSTTDFQTLLDGKTGLTYRVAPIFSPNNNQWQTNSWSSTRWNQYRANCAAGLGLSTDSPPYYYNVSGREGYRQFTADEIIWGNNASNVSTLLYLHPGSSTNYLVESISEIDNLAGKGAIPSTYCISSYYGTNSIDSEIHYIGWENGTVNEIVRVADYVINHY